MVAPASATTSPNLNSTVFNCGASAEKTSEESDASNRFGDLAITHSSACSAGARSRLSATDATIQVSDATTIRADVSDSELKAATDDKILPRSDSGQSQAFISLRGISMVEGIAHD